MRVVAVDAGAGSVRLLAVRLSGERLEIERQSAFATPWYDDGRFERWDLRAVVEGIRNGLADAGEFDSWSVDTWGVDFGLLDEQGRPIADPIRYRDLSHEAGRRAMDERIGRERLYSLTGIQPHPFNTAAQLMARRLRGDEELAQAKRLLFLPDLIHELVGGKAQTAERSIASTSELLGLDGEWCGEVCDAIGVRNLLPAICAEGRQSDGVRTLGHDTACAVLAAPGEGDDWAYISSGTWSLVGVELERPIATPEAMQAGFTNERGYGGSVRFLKNVMGLWLLERARGERPIEQCLAEAERAEPTGVHFDVNHPSLLNPDDMAAAIRALADGPLGSEAALYRCILENLASAYAEAIAQVERLTGKAVQRIHVVGGGCRNRLLNELTAQATGKPIILGPVEATAVGNALVQLAALRGAPDSREELRAVVRRSFRLETVEPKGGAG